MQNLLTDDTYNGTYAVEQVREGSGPPIFFVSGYNSSRTWNNPGTNWWQPLIDRGFNGQNGKYANSPGFRVIWPNYAGDSNIGKTYKNWLHKELSKTRYIKIPGIKLETTVNPALDFENAKSRAERCGRLLAVYLANNFKNQWPVLVGHSLGTRVVATAAHELTSEYGAGQLTSIHLMGAALHRAENWDNRLAHATTQGVYNYFSDHEKFEIQALYGLSIGFKSRPLGTLGLGWRADNQPLITDIDVTECVPHHNAYFDNIVLN
jgi:pimeloyl-ACP methyl ester carboxylesterase